MQTLRLVGVGDLCRYLKGLIEGDELLQDIWLYGEISNFVLATSGHIYFTLKDTNGQIDCAFFLRQQRSSLAALSHLQHGRAILAHGHISLYEAKGKYQFYVDEVQPAGLGELHVRFEYIKKQLDQEGLFDLDHKRAIPAFPRTVGIVTSPTAAAFQDILRTLQQRCPLVEVLLSPTLVQGEDAPANIAAAIKLLNEQPDIDVIIVARGGGSLEDLWAFNDEQVARAIYHSRLPVISGVGHETDFTIADFVADLRASTPTAAAVQAVPDVMEWRLQLTEATRRLYQAMISQIESSRRDVYLRERDLQRASPLSTLNLSRQRIDELTRQLNLQIERFLELKEQAIRNIAVRLHSLSPLQTLGRGYALVRDQQGVLISSVTQLSSGQTIEIRLKDGPVRATVE